MERGIIAILDALGIQSIHARENPDKIVGKWDYVIESFLGFEQYNNESKRSSGTAEVRTFSDTVLISYTGHLDDYKGLSDIGRHLNLNFCNALMEGIFFRGVISIGLFKQSQLIMIGPAIDEAMSWFGRHDWMGIVLAPSASFTLDQYEQEGKLNEWYIKYDVPISKRLSTTDTFDKNMWVLNWPKTMPDILEIQENESDPKSALLEVFRINPITPNVISKYKNTIDFYDKVLPKTKTSKYI